MSNAILTAPAAAAERTFFGQPQGLAYLAFTEAWERFSYYGMTSLLMLYMTQQLLVPGHVENVSGFGAFRAGVETLFGPMTTIALASQINGLYTGFVYFTPVFGGMIADRWIGRRNAVVAGALLMSAGHIAMAFEQSFLLALTLLVLGCGLLKGNISTQVGGLYGRDDGAGRTRGFAIFSCAINVGAVTGPLVCGLLAQIWGWHAGFGLAGGLMLIGLATYLAGYRTLSENHDVHADPKSPAPIASKIGARDLKVLAPVFVTMALSVSATVAYNQLTNIGPIWINDHVDLNLLGFRIPVAWFYSIDSLVSILAVPLLFTLWRWQERHGGEPGEIRKAATGAFCFCAANLIAAFAALLSPHPSVLFPIFSFVLLGVGFLYYWPTLLALVSEVSPPGIRSTMMGLVFLTLFVGNMIVGRLGALYEPMGPAAFWGLHAAIAAAGGVLSLLLAGPLERRFRPGAGG